MNSDENKTKDFKHPRGGDHSHIKGWGIDADSKNDPTYPIRKRINEEQQGADWKRPTQQQVDVELLQSVERPNITAVFGTSVPPSGISGTIRRKAFQKSEGSYGRWLPLILADRIGAYEGIIDDLKNGVFPNTFAERGWGAEWKYNRQKFLIKTAVGALAVAGALAILISSNREKSHSE